MCTDLGKKYKHVVRCVPKVILMVVFLSGCSPTTKHKILSIFFDGVPPVQMGNKELPEKSKEQPKQDQTVLTGSETQPPGPPPEGPKLFVHYPFAERMCDSCHVKKFSQSLNAEVKELCFSCHDNFLEKMKTKHYPAEEGLCLDCHNPHQSENEKLLIKKGRELCFTCHDQGDLLKAEPHNEIGDESCLSCHDPHGG